MIFFHPGHTVPSCYWYKSPSRIRVRVFSLGCNLHRDDENAPFCHFWSDFFQIFGQLDDCHEELYLPVKLSWSYSKQWLQKRENKYNRVAARQQFTISSKLRRRPWPCRRAPRPYYLFKMRAQLHCSISETAVQQATSRREKIWKMIISY